VRGHLSVLQRIFGSGVLDTDAVIRYGPAAAERATTLGAHREAAQLYALTLRHAHSTTNEQKVQWIERHAITSFLCGLGEAAESSWREAIARRRALGDRRRESVNLLWLSLPLWGLGRHTEANDAARQSLRLVEELGPSRLLAHSLVNLAELAAFGFDPAATDYAAKAIGLGTELGERAVVIRASSYAALARVLRTDTGWDELEDAWRDAMAETRGYHAGLPGPMPLAFIRITGIICWIAALHRDLDRASRYIAESVAFCRDRDFYVFEGFVVSIDGLVGFYRGDWDRAIACAEDLLTRPRLSVFHRIMPLTTLALIHARRGEQPVSSLLDDAVADSEPDLLRLGAVWAARAEAAWLAGDDDTARAEAQAGLAAAPAYADPWLLGDLQRWAHLPGAPPASIAIDDPITPYQLEISGDWPGAAAEWARRGCPYDAAVAQLGGDMAAVQAALATFRGLGARTAARRARQRLAELGGRTPDTRHSSTSADPHGLTRRQREVLDLLAAGHSDTEIAAALCLSPRTVNNHVGAILAKLGVHSRKQAAVYAEQHTKS
jgi:DNA-binding CsgD family transcriptional regulator